MEYIVTWMITGGISVEAEDPEEAREKFDEIFDNLTAEEIVANGVTVTGCEVPGE